MYFWSVSLVYQLSGQFLIFLVDQKKSDQPKKILVYQKEIWLTKKRIWYQKKNLVDQKKNLVAKKIFGIQKKIWYTKKKFGRPKKWEIDQIYWYTKETDQKYMDAAIMFWQNIHDVIWNV